MVAIFDRTISLDPTIPPPPVHHNFVYFFFCSLSLSSISLIFCHYCLPTKRKEKTSSSISRNIHIYYTTAFSPAASKNLQTHQINSNHTMMPSSLSAAMLLLAASTKTAVASETNIEVVERRFPKAGDLCVSQSKTFTVSVDLYAGELGSYVLEECGDHLWNPTIAMEIGETYTFVQKHRTNYYHRTCLQLGAVFFLFFPKRNRRHRKSIRVQVLMV